MVSAGNRVEDRALVRTMSSALINRVIILHIRVDYREWLQWSSDNSIREEVRAFIAFLPGALSRAVPDEPAPFSSPRSWAQFAGALDALEAAKKLTKSAVRAIAFGLLSAEDAALFCAVGEAQLGPLVSLDELLADPTLVPQDPIKQWTAVHQLRVALSVGALGNVQPAQLNALLLRFSPEMCMACLIGNVAAFGRLGADPAMLERFRVVIGR